MKMAAMVREENGRRAWSEYLEGRERVGSRPFRASIEISRNCNLRCVMCPQSWDERYARRHAEYDMLPELFDRIAGELFPLMEHVHLQGFGETTLSPHWLNILESCRPYAQERRFGLVTNMTRVDDGMWGRMAEMGFEVDASYDGATRETFEGIRRGARFEAVERNLSVLGRAIEDRGRGSLTLLVTLQKMNYRELPLFVDAAARHGARALTFASVRGEDFSAAGAARSALARLRAAGGKGGSVRELWGLAKTRARLWLSEGTPRLGLSDVPPEELAALKAQTLRRAREAGVAVRFNDDQLAGIGNPPSHAAARVPSLTELKPDDGIARSQEVSRFQRCFKPYSYVVVNYRGDVGLCNHLIADGSWKQMGSLRESTFEEIWNSPLYQEQRRRLTSADPDNPACAWCFAHRLSD